MADADMQRATKLKQAKRRRKRWAIAAAASLLVCAASCFIFSEVGFAGRASLALHGASLDVAYYDKPVPQVRGISVRGFPLAPEWLPSFEQLTHQLFTASQQQTIHLTVLVFPVWPLPLLCGGMVAWHHRRVRRLSRTGCQSCGYDTNGLAANVCPECGTTCTV